MDVKKTLMLRNWLAQLTTDQNEDEMRCVVLLLTLVVELFAPQWLRKVHTQNYARAKCGRDSVEADRAGARLKCALEEYADELMRSPVSAENFKREFAKANPANDWSTTGPMTKAAEEFKELVEALHTEPQYSERVLDAILDVVYAGTEVRGLHY